MGLKLSNNAISRLAGNISNADTAINLVPAGGAQFPVLGAGDWFPATIVKGTGEFEVVQVTARSADTLTVLRGQEATVAQAFNAGDRIELRLTAGAFTNITDSKLDKAGGAIAGALAVAGAITQGGNQVWHAGNLNPGIYAPLNAPTFTGVITTATVNAAMAGDSTCSIIVKSGGGAGDTNLAMAGFLCGGAYGIKLGLRADGYFGLGGWSSTAWRWYSGANGDMYSAGNVTAYSDPRLKDDVSRIDGALDIIEQLDGVRFTWNNKTDLIGKPGQRDIGVLADQVERVLPEIVGRSIPDEKNGGEQWRVVAYDKIIPVLIEAVRELRAEVRDLREGR